MKQLCFGLLLLVSGCSPATPPAPAALEDTSTLEAAGGFELGMSPAQVHSAAASRGDSLTCVIRDAYFLCQPGAVRAIEPYTLMFHAGRLQSIHWHVELSLAELRSRYRGLGTLAAVGSGSDSLPEDSMAFWISEDTTVSRTAICVKGQSPGCVVSAGREKRTKVRDRITSLQQAFDARAARREKNAP